MTIHYINHKVQQKDMHWTGMVKVQGRGVDKENLEKIKRMGTAEGRRKLERSKMTSFGWNQMEELQEGHMFHKGTRGVYDDEDI